MSDDTSPVHAYQNSSSPMTLMIGVPNGRTRPAMWGVVGNVSIVLAQFHGEEEMLAMVEFMDSHTNDIQKVINYHNQKAQERQDGTVGTD